MGLIHFGNHFNKLSVGFQNVQALKYSDPLKTSQIEKKVFLTIR